MSDDFENDPYDEAPVHQLDEDGLVDDHGGPLDEGDDATPLGGDDGRGRAGDSAGDEEASRERASRPDGDAPRR